MRDEGPEWRTVLRVSLPGAAASLVNGLYTLGDAYFIGRLGTEALAAIALSFPLVGILGGIGNAFGSGTAAAVSRRLGSGEFAAARRVTAVSIIWCALAGAVSALILIVIRIPFLRVMGGTGAIVGLSDGYLKVLIPGAVITLGNMNLAGITRARGKPITAMTVVFLGAGLNLILDPLFIFTMGLGIPGAAWATIAAQGISSAVFLGVLIADGRKSGIGSRRGGEPRAAKILTEILSVGAAALIANLFITAGTAAMNMIAAGFGDEVIAVSGITLRVFAFGMFPLFGMAQGFLPAAGYAFGARDYGRMGRLIRWQVLVVLGFCAAVSVPIMAFAPSISRAFFGDPRTVLLSARYLRTVFALFPLLGLLLSGTVLLQSAGEWKQAAALSVLRLGAGFAPLMYAASLVLGPMGIPVSQPIADTGSFILLVWFMMRLRASLRKARESR